MLKSGINKFYGLSSNIEDLQEFNKVNSKYSADVLQSFLNKNFNFRKMDNIYFKLNIAPSKFKSKKMNYFLVIKNLKTLLIIISFYQTLNLECTII
jgi:hypothetical protein